MTYIDLYEDNSIRIGDVVTSGDNDRILPRTLVATKNEANAIFINDIYTGKSALAEYDVAKLTLGGVVYSTAAAFVDAFNSTLSVVNSEVAANGSPTDAPASSTVAETAAASSSISLLKGIKNILILVKAELSAILAKFTDGLMKTQVVNSAGLDATGICDGYAAVTPNDNADLDDAGWIECRTAAGTMAFVDNKGVSGTITLALNETTKFRVKRVLSTGTSATGLVCYY